MSAPQLTDANTSSEWFRTVAEPGAEKPRSPSQAAIPVSASARPKRFVRLVTYTMFGLVAFTLLGVVSFAVRQNSMQSALAAPAPAPLAVATPAVPAPLAEAPAPRDANVDSAPPAPPAPPATVKKTAASAAKAKSSKSTKVTKKTAARSPFLSSR